MEHHFHLGVEHIVLGAVAIALAFHGGQIAGAYLAKANNDFVSQAGKSLGAFFTFGGSAS